jgi:hypothetical protein
LNWAIRLDGKGGGNLLDVDGEQTEIVVAAYGLSGLGNEGSCMQGI